MCSPAKAIFNIKIHVLFKAISSNCTYRRKKRIYIFCICGYVFKYITCTDISFNIYSYIYVYLKNMINLFIFIRIYIYTYHHFVLHLGETTALNWSNLFLHHHPQKNLVFLIVQKCFEENPSDFS